MIVFDDLGEILPDGRMIPPHARSASDWPSRREPP
jgi:hypothetical protein